MASEDIDHADVERLVQGLSALASSPSSMPAAPAASAEAASSGPTRAGFAPGRPFTTARLLMPPVRKEPWRAFAFASAIKLPALPTIALPAPPSLSALLARAGLPALPSLKDANWGTLSVRTFVGLGVLFSGSMCYWPYAHAWSWGLLLYLAAVMLVVVTGIWGAKLSWDARLPAAHTVAIGTVVWGLGLLAVEAVPRIGYV